MMRIFHRFVHKLIGFNFKKIRFLHITKQDFTFVASFETKTSCCMKQVLDDLPIKITNKTTHVDRVVFKTIRFDWVFINPHISTFSWE